MLEGLVQTETGKAVVDKLTNAQTKEVKTTKD